MNKELFKTDEQTTLYAYAPGDSECWFSKEMTSLTITREGRDLVAEFMGHQRLSKAKLWFEFPATQLIVLDGWGHPPAAMHGPEMHAFKGRLDAYLSENADRNLVIERFRV